MVPANPPNWHGLGEDGKELLLTVALAVLAAVIVAGAGNCRAGARGDPARLLERRRRRRRRPRRPGRSGLLGDIGRRRVGPATSGSARPAPADRADRADRRAPPAPPAPPARRAPPAPPAPPAPRGRAAVRRVPAASAGSGRHTGGGGSRAHGNGGTPARSDHGSRASRRPPRRPDKPNGVPTNANPTLTVGSSGPAPLGVPNFVIGAVRDPALPAPDLPGLRNPVRDPVGGARLDQQDRDRVRHQPQRIDRGRRRLDAVHALDLAGVRRRRQRRRPQATRTTRSTRSAPPPAT